MGILNFSDGMFICNDCRENLNMDIDQETFEALKEEISKSEHKDDLKPCYICRKQGDMKDGLMLDKCWIIDGLEAHINKSDELMQRFNRGVLTCDCGQKIKFTDKKVTCPHCNALINTKRYRRKIKMGLTQKTTLKILIKHLKGKTTVPELRGRNIEKQEDKTLTAK